jgi:hypothetical protein
LAHATAPERTLTALLRAARYGLSAFTENISGQVGRVEPFTVT